ncbi:SpoIIIAH-like family protein [Paenibacillus guangzhouensis]|uniref:SpoIIIAH-like family protein n=1 Tax=Paenibacillus guangzhouensis TaxID=1473112 RepID=UPI00187BA3B8|nr:SpoIIIAH-like family protein [Paenibacillus guangzhouensis]
MNTKRQTIWLVSMLSIMVVLSAYYLFTEPASTNTNTNKVAQNGQVEQTKKNATEASLNGTPDSLTEVKVDEVTDPNLNATKDANKSTEGTTTDKGKPSETDATKGTDKASDATKGTDKATDAKAGDAGKAADSKVLASDKTDEAILDELSKEGASSVDTLAAVQQQRNQNYSEQIDKLQAIVNDMSKSPDESMKAEQEMSAIESQEQKITTLEEELRKQFGKAAIQLDNDKFKVVVASDQLEITEAVHIVDLLVKELKITQDKVSVQRVAP